MVKQLFIFLSAILLLTSCSKDILTDKELYDISVKAVKHPTADDFRDLVTINKDDDRIYYDDDMVVLTTFHTVPAYFQENKTYTAKKDLVWFTSAKELFNKIANNKVNCSLERMKQLIGYFPDAKIDYLSVITISPEDVLRPAFNPDPKSKLMYLSLQDKNNPFLKMIDTMHKTSEYNFTALGYTYDTKAADHYGLTEFVIEKGHNYSVKHTIAIDDLIKKGCNFSYK